MAKILINGDNLTIDDIISVSRYRKGIELSPEAIDKIDESRETIEELSKRIFQFMELILVLENYAT